MWNQIRKAPYSGVVQGGKLEVIAGAFQVCPKKVEVDLTRTLLALPTNHPSHRSRNIKLKVRSFHCYVSGALYGVRMPMYG